MLVHVTLLPPRPVRYALAWAGAAVVAVAVGLLAVSLLGGEMGPTLAAGATASATTSGSATTVAGGTQPYRTEGGTVYATCPARGTTPDVTSIAASGWTDHSSPNHAAVTFESADREIQIVVTCNSAGIAVFTAATDDRHGSGSSAAPTPGAPATTTAGGDDHGGGSGSGGSTGTTSAPGPGSTPATTEPGDDSGGSRGGSGASSTPAPTATATATSGRGGGSGGGHGGGSDDATPHT